MKKKLLINTILYTVLPKLPTVASILILPFITPYLTLEDYGKFGLIIAYYSAFSLFVTLGQDVVLQNAFFEYRKHYPKIWNRVLGIMIVGSVLISLVLAFVFFDLLGSRLSSEFITVSSLIATALICTPINTMAQVYYVMREAPYPLALRSIIMGTLNAIIVLVSIKYFKAGYLGWVIGFAANGITSVAFFLYPVCIKNGIYPNFRCKKKHLREYLKVGLPLLPHHLAVYIFNTSSRLFLDFFKVNVKAIGLYSQGNNIGSNGMVYISGLFSALSRTLQEALRNRTELNRIRMKKIFILVVTGSGVLFFNSSLWMKEIYLFLFKNPELQTGYYIAIIFMMSFVFYPLYDFAMYPLFVAKKTHLVAKISIIAAVCSLVGNLVFIPLYGYTAALYTNYISFMIFGVGGLLSKDIRIELTWIFKSPVSVYMLSVFYGLLLTLAAIFLMDTAPAFKLIISGLSVVILGFGLIFGKVVVIPRGLIRFS